MSSNHYNTAVGLQERELSLLFQRFNFFFAGTAFLITAYASVVVSQYFLQQHYCQLVILAHAINAVGYYLSIIFMVSHYINARIIDEIGKNVILLEEDKFAVAPFKHLRNDVAAHLLEISLIKLIKELLRDALETILRPTKMHVPAPHTWIVPIGFVLFWIILWFLVLPGNWPPVIGGLVVPAILVGITSAIRHHDSKRKK